MSKEYSSEISQIIALLEEKITNRNSAKELAEQLFKGSKESGEISNNFDVWFKYRLKPQMIWLEKDDYLKALVNALWLAPVFAGTDFGSSRQRDMAQVWTDTARGFLGEIAFSKFLTRYHIEVKFDMRRGSLEEFLPSDISEIKKDGTWKKCNLKLSIKTTKFNGHWMDLPGDQYNHSDAFILIKLGILRHHFVSFLKAISFIKDKLFPSAKQLNILKDEEADLLWEEIPSFYPIPAYVAGFLIKKDLNMPVHSIQVKLIGRKNKRISITGGVFELDEDMLYDCDLIKQIARGERLPIEVAPIGELSGRHFLASSGALKYGSDWNKLVSKL